MTLVQAMTEIATAVSSTFVAIAQSLSGIFFTSTQTTAGEIVSNITPLGYLALISLVTGFVLLVFNKIFGLFRGRGR